MTDAYFMRLALRLARRGYGATSPNPMVGAVLVKGGKILGRGWHHRAGEPHAEIEALRDAQKLGHSPRGATLFVTLEPCCTHGRTPPCTDAIIAAGIKRVVVGATDPNPHHAGRGFAILQRAGIKVVHGILAEECTRLNEAFNHWIVHRTPLVTVKAAMTLDGKIATANGESKWITGERARAYGMKLRQGSDAILVGINTVLADDPSLTFRHARRLSAALAERGSVTRSALPAEPGSKTVSTSHRHGSAAAPQTALRERGAGTHRLRRIILDSLARTPLTAKVVTDEYAYLTTIVVSKSAPKKRVAALARQTNVLVAPTTKRSSPATHHSSLDLEWLLKGLGAVGITSLLVEGGGEVNASFLLGGRAQRVAFFYAPKILGGRNSRKGVAGDGVKSLSEVVPLTDLRWQKLGADLLLTARVG